MKFPVLTLASDFLVENFFSAHDPAAAQQPAPIIVQVPNQPGENEAIKALKAQMDELKQMLLAQQVPPKPKKKDDDTTQTINPEILQLIEGQKQLLAAQKKAQEDQLALVEKQRVQATIQDMLEQVNQQTNGEFDPNVLDMTSVAGFQASIPKALKAYEQARGFFFKQFMSGLEAQAKEKTVTNLNGAPQTNQSLIAKLLANMPQQGNGVQAPVNTNTEQPKFTHPMIDGGVSYAAMRANPMMANMVPNMASNAFANQQIQQRQQQVTGQIPQNQTQLAYLLQQMQANTQQQQPQNTQGNLEQQLRALLGQQQQQINQPAVAPLPDPSMTKGTSLKQLDQNQVNGAHMAALASIEAKRKGGRFAQRVDTRGVNLMQAMTQATDGGGGASNVLDITALLAKVQADQRTPAGLALG